MAAASSAAVPPCASSGTSGAEGSGAMGVGVRRTAAVRGRAPLHSAAVSTAPAAPERESAATLREEAAATTSGDGIARRCAHGERAVRPRAGRPPTPTHLQPNGEAHVHGANEHR